ncbi:hypothetical protein GUJ93_ZPchr0001g31208 [Zizania palustris]|uniref:Uncharacterized protein n=1 Tax=Zizania palustris TaxID=103762 RepID=A0A8J5R900_ZIZPA|nr:hypothetical protein GUJ93_ZPchr0001g31208 [Zizania palustris]
MAPPLAAPRFHAGSPPPRSSPHGRTTRSRAALIDAPESIGDGLSFSGNGSTCYLSPEYTASLESLINVLAPDKLSIVFQGYFAPILPSTLACFSNFLLGEIFSQDPLRASDKALTSSGPYMMKEEDSMLYRRPYLASGSSGFTLNAISRAMKKDLKVYIESMRNIIIYWQAIHGQPFRTANDRAPCAGGSW